MTIKMKDLNVAVPKVTFLLFLTLLAVCDARAQYPGIKDDIARYRKGELVVNAKPGAKVTVEQLRHEFWFGAAISNGFGSGSMPAEDFKQYGEKFLANFNSAGTENAVKWLSMEPEQGQVNYKVVDGILEWAEKHDIPVRAHNLFWGVPNRVQPWLKEMDDKELLRTMQHRAETVTKRYKGRFAEYDLNNAMIHGNYCEERLGPEITKLMAEWAHNGDPDAKLC